MYFLLLLIYTIIIRVLYVIDLCCALYMVVFDLYFYLFCIMMLSYILLDFAKSAKNVVISMKKTEKVCIV